MSNKIISETSLPSSKFTCRWKSWRPASEPAWSRRLSDHQPCKIPRGSRTEPRLSYSSFRNSSAVLPSPSRWLHGGSPSCVSQIASPLGRCRRVLQWSDTCSPQTDPSERTDTWNGIFGNRLTGRLNALAVWNTTVALNYMVHILTWVPVILMLGEGQPEVLSSSCNTWCGIGDHASSAFPSSHRSFSPNQSNKNQTRTSIDYK